MSKGKTGREWHIRWEPAEWLKVAAMAVHLIETQGMTATDAVWAGMHGVLPQHRWQAMDRIKQVTNAKQHSDVWKKYAAKVGLMTPKERQHVLQSEVISPKPSRQQLAAQAEAEAQALAERAEVERKAANAERQRERRAALKAEGVKRTDHTKSHAQRVAQRDANREFHALIEAAAAKMGNTYTSYKEANKAQNTGARWTKLEWAMIARSAEWMAQQRPNDTLTRHVYEAQLWTLPPDRQRSRAGISQAFSAGTLPNEVQQGLNDRWLIESVPFVTPITTEQAEQPEQPEQLATEPEALASPPAAADEPTTTTAEASPLVQPSSLAAAGGALPLSSLAQASKAFAETIIGALDSLLATHSRLLLDQVNTRIEATAQDMGTQVAALIEHGMRRTVHQLVESELGGPVSAPAQAPKPNPTDAPAAGGVDIDRVHTIAPRRVKIDVVGMPHGAILHEIKSQIDPARVDVTFIANDVQASYAPHRNRHLIMIQQKIPHSLSNKIKAAKIDPIFVPRATAGHVVHAIDELVRGASQ